MFKSLIAVMLTLFLVLGGMGKPAYAYSEVIPLMNLAGSNTGSLFAMSSPSQNSGLDVIEDVVKPVTVQLVTVGTFIGICMAADAAASTVFPPAVALMPYCAPVVGAFTGGAVVEKTVFKGVLVKTITKLAR